MEYKSNDVTPNRDLVLERVRLRHPGVELADDEAMFGQIGKDYDELEEDIRRRSEREGRLGDLLARDPRSARFLADMADGKDPWVAVIERLGIDGVTDLMNDPSKQEAYAEANKAYVERLSKERGLEEEFQRNFSESMRALEAMQRERGLGDDEVDAAMDLVMGVVNDAVMGKFTPETLDMALKALGRDAAVDAARREGEVAGRNARIDERLRLSKDGDGLPALSGSNNAPAGRRAGPRSIFDIARGEE